MSLQPHERILPAFDISEEGLRQLEIWLLERLQQGGNGWRFNVLNGISTAKATERGYGYVQTTACVDLDTTPDPLAQGGTIGLAFQDDSGCGALFGSTTFTTIKTKGGPTSIIADGGPVTVFSNGDDVIVGPMSAGQNLTVLDHLSSPILQMTEGTTDLHIPTGGNVIADL